MGEKYIFYKPKKSLFRKIVEKTAPLIVAGGVAFGIMDKDIPKEQQSTQENVKDFEKYKQELEESFKQQPDFLSDEIEQSLSSVYSKENKEATLSEFNGYKLEIEKEVYGKLFANKEFFAEKYFGHVLKDRDYRQELLSVVMEAADKYGVPHAVALGMLAVESGGNPLARSKKDAIGIFQIITDTAKIYKMNVDKDFPENDDRSDIVKNADTAMRILSDYYKILGQWSLALVAFNGGPNALEKQLVKLYDLDMKEGFVTRSGWRQYREKAEEGQINLALILKNNPEFKNMDAFKYPLKVQILAPEMKNILNFGELAFQQGNVEKPEFL